jgi:hypothetical protein
MKILIYRNFKNGPILGFALVRDTKVTNLFIRRDVKCLDGSLIYTLDSPKVSLYWDHLVNDRSFKEVKVVKVRGKRQ